jgi:iron complex outermembrane recepter protein
LQDEISLNKRLHVTLGSKFEHNAFTGFEVEPNIRFLANVSDKQSVWAAVSRAVRTPAITENGLRLASGVLPPGVVGPLPAIEAVYGSTNFQSEDLLAYEVGYRVQATSKVSADVSAFYNNYTNLRSAEEGTPFVEGSPVPTDIVIPFVAENKMGGGTYGIEPFVDWKVLPIWKLFSSYTYLQMDIRKDANSVDPTPDLPNGENPENQFYFRSSLDLPWHLEQDFAVRRVGRLPSYAIPAYSSVDAGIGWRPLPNLEVSFNGQNWLDSRHIEFIPDFINTMPTVVTRSYYGAITWSFTKR